MLTHHLGYAYNHIRKGGMAVGTICDEPADRVETEKEEETSHYSRSPSGGKNMAYEGIWKNLFFLCCLYQL